MRNRKEVRPERVMVTRETFSTGRKHLRKAISENADLVSSGVLLYIKPKSIFE